MKVKLKRATLDRIVVFWGMLSLASVSIVSDPELIDGISYFKVAVAIISMSLIAPILLFQLIIQEKRYILMSFLGLTFFFLFTALLDQQNNYRDVFGAPGRSNGIISIINFMYFLIFGIYVSATSRIKDLVKTLSLISPLICILVIFATEFDLLSNTFLAAWNFKNYSFQENSNLVAPLLAIGLVNSILQFILKASFTKLLLLIPQCYLLLELALLQSILAVGAGIFVFLILRKQLELNLIWIPVTIGALYLIGFWITGVPNFLQDPSIVERRNILLIFGDLLGKVTILPKNIDALSDFTSDYKSAQILDDFHNVFLQVIFSYGILLGVSFFIISVWPFWKISKTSQYRTAIISMYTTFFISLTVGIVSPNYIYFGAVLIGATISNSRTKKIINVSRFGIREGVLTFLLIVAVLIPPSRQIEDYLVREKISQLTQKGNIDPNNLESLSDAVANLSDAGYLYLVARNFYIVGECARGDKVMKAMLQTNKREVRIDRLREFERSCKELPTDF